MESVKFLHVESGIREHFACGIRNLGLWNPEYCSRNPGIPITIEIQKPSSTDKDWADLHLFQTRFVIRWENKRDGDITMPLSLESIGSAGYMDH